LYITVGHSEYDLMLEKIENTETKMDAKFIKGVCPFLSHFECLHNLNVKVLKRTICFPLPKFSGSIKNTAFFAEFKSVFKNSKKVHQNVISQNIY
jgi:hypothetical protein